MFLMKHRLDVVFHFFMLNKYSSALGNALQPFFKKQLHLFLRIKTGIGIP